MEEFIRQLAEAVSLSDEQVTEAVVQLVDEGVPAETKAAFLTALAQKGETVEEIFAFARELRDRAIRPPLDPEIAGGVIIDLCGTGGDKLNTFNISTTAAMVVASAGVAVAKHGNRAVTSQSGSADVLEALGIRVDSSPEESAQSLREHQFCFLFAPHYHPAFAHIASARKLCAKQGQRTIFNFLGPLLNPARPSVQLIGVPHPDLCEPMARVLQSLGSRRGMVVSGRVDSVPVSDGPAHLDELSILGQTTIAEFYQARGFNCSVLGLEGFPVQKACLSDLRGSDRASNAETVRRILRGEDRSPKRDAVLLNAAAALYVAERTDSLTEGWSFAAELIDAGTAYQKLLDLVERSRMHS